jgi:hypothetical protein
MSALYCDMTPEKWFAKMRIRGKGFACGNQSVVAKLTHFL